MFVHSVEAAARTERLTCDRPTWEAIGRESGKVPPELRALPRSSYAYLLGLYLGDGWIAAVKKTYVLRISLDQRYPGILLAAAHAIEGVHPRGRSRTHARQGCSVVSSYWKCWPAVFPQHGAGPKHARKIALTDWQLEITAAQPLDLIRGLIHSDGCRFVAHQRRHGKTYAYDRYSFSNRSEDIKAIFCAHLDAVGIRWTRPNDDAIAIARRADVAKLDAFVGPKR